MDRAELRKQIVGPVAPVATPFDEDYEVDYGKMHDLAQWWVESGIVKGRGVIKVAAAAGEGPMLRDDEWPYLLRTVVQATGGKATVMCGLHYKDTKRTIEDARRAQDMGAVALQVCPPIFNMPSQGDILDYFSDLADAIDIGIMVYHTHWMSGGRIDTDTFLKMADLKNVVAIKWSPHDGQRYEDIAKFVGRFNVVDNTVDPVRCHRLGGHGFVQTTVEAYPAHDLKVYDLMQQKKYDEAEALYRKVQGPLREFGSKITVRSGGQGRTMKGILAILGNPIGSSRPPSKPLNKAEMDELREIVRGFGWPVKG
ncbi:MAG: dihydrodipicolinate synthase family protein [SAR202 cluster bacterium]|nr:dihydrodipicolinate synthase family protein [SAR202 cluster bacterium]